MSRQTSVYLRDGQMEAVEAVVSETDLSKSETIRRLVAEGLDSVDGWDDLIPEHVQIKQDREAVKAENRVNDWRGGFEGRVKDALVRRWKNGYAPDELADVASGYVEEARVLWPNDEQRQAEAVAYVREAVDQIAEAHDEAEVDPLDVESAVAAFDGMSQSQREQAVEEVDEDKMEELVRVAYQRLKDSRATSGMVVDGLSRKFEVQEEVAEEAVERARDAL
jgi:hypothetical protein